MTFEITHFSDGDGIVHNSKAKYDIILMDILMVVFILKIML